MAVNTNRTDSSRSWFRASMFCSTTAVICLAMAAQSFAFAGSDITHRETEMRNLAASCGIFLLIGAALSFDISNFNPPKSHSYTSLLMHYGMTRIAIIFGNRYYRHFLERCGDIEEQQDLMCVDIIETNADTVYGLKYEFRKMETLDKYRKQHPLTTYEHYRTMMDKIVLNGSMNIFTKLDPLFLAETAGTTGKRKIIPLNGEFLHSRLKTNAAYALVNAQKKGLGVNLGKCLLMLYEPTVQETEGGLKLSSISHFISAGVKNLPYLICDPIAFDIKKERTAFYVHAVFALRDKDIGSLFFGFASQLLDFWRFVIENAEDICNDIENGKLDEKLDLPLKMSVLLNYGLKKDAKRAKEVITQIRKGTNGLALRLWPCVAYARTIGTGSMEVHADILRKSYMKGVPLLTINHESTECVYGLNISPEVDDYTFALAYENAFYEFIPEHLCDKENPGTLLAHELDVGDSYEMVATTKMGLYRYRTNDIITVVRFEKQCPIYKFSYRLGQLLNVYCEKTPENVLQRAVMAASDELGLTIVDFTSTEDVYYYGIKGVMDATRGYILFIEFEGRKKLSKQKLEKFDECLSKESQIYGKHRENGSIGQMEVLQVAPGGFHTLANSMNMPRSLSFKIPRVLRNKNHLDILHENLI